MSMLKKSLRLKSSRQFSQTLRNRQRYVDRCFAVYALRRPEQAATAVSFLPRFGLIVSKKTEKRAVRRNRIKRQFREILRTQIIPEYSARLSHWQTVVIIIRPQALNTPFDQLKLKLKQCFTNLPISSLNK